MNLDDYQQAARKTAIYAGAGDGDWTYPALGLGSETGEVLSVLAKVVRDDAGEISSEARTKLTYELGDVLWCLSALASELGLYLSDIAELNLQKLDDRRARGKLGGSGDGR